MMGCLSSLVISTGGPRESLPSPLFVPFMVAIAYLFTNSESDICYVPGRRKMIEGLIP